MDATQSGPVLDTGSRFMSGASGRWAGERMMAAIRTGEQITPGVLRTNEILTNDEWKFFDEEIVEEATLRLRGVADLIAAGNVRRLTNGLSKTVLEYWKSGDMDPAIVSMSGVARSENDRFDIDMAGLPLPITHKDFFIDLRTLLASRNGGEGLDTAMLRIAGRKVAEETERMLFAGGKTFAGLTIYGYTTHPNRNTAVFGAGGSWNLAAKTGEQIIADVNTMVGLLNGDKHYGPFWLYISPDMALKMGEDYRAGSDRTVRTRITEIEGVVQIRVADMLPAATAVMVSPTPDVIQMIEGEPLQTIQWDVHGGFQINFKAFQIMVPLIRADINGRSGIVHMA